MIHIIDKQSDEIVGIIPPNEFWDDNYHRSLETTAETFEFTTFADRDYSEYLTGRNKVIIPDEDGGYRELTIWQAEKVHEHSKHIVVFTKASYNDLRKAQVIKPQTLKSQSASTAAATILRGTEWSVGLVEGKGSRTFHIEKHTDPYSMLKRIATEFDLELDFRIETKGNKITGRYVDLVQQIGQWRGREIEFGKDLLSIRRIEDTDNIYTALIGLGPEKDGSRLEVLVEDYDALQRWGRRDPVTGELRHIIGTYEPQTEKEELSYDRLRELTKNELEKRINEIVEYEAEIADLEHVPGMENEKIRFGDTLKIKDTLFNPPLYVEARVFEVSGSIKERGKKSVKLGDFIEYSEEEVQAVWKSLQDEIKRSLARMLTVNIISNAGDTFKNGVGEADLTAVVYAQGKESDQDGETYSYVWSKYDKFGNQDTRYRKEGKTITVTANEIDEKAMYACEVVFQDVAILGFITLSNVYDGKDGMQGIPGPPGENGQTLYTWVKYADTPTSGMSDNPNGKEYIGLAYNKTSPNESSNYSDYQWTKVKGDQGVPGPPGENGQPNYTWVKYADDDKGTGMSDNPDGKRYLGLAYNKTTQTESTNPSDYNWSPLYDNVQVGGRNLFVIKDALVNSVFKWADGEVATETDSLVSGFIEVLANENIICNYTISQIMFYDKDKVYIGTYRDGELVPVGGQTRPTDKITVPNKQSIAYMRVSFRDGFLEDASVEGKKVKLEKGNVETDWTPAPEDQEAYAEYIAQLKADLAEEEAKAHADGIVTAEEQARINDVQAKLEQAKQHANQKSSEAEQKAKSHADTKASQAEENAKTHADKAAKEKSDQALRDAKAFSENASNIKKGIIDVGSVPIRTAANGARIQWDGTNGFVQYDSSGNPVSWLDLKGNSRFVNTYLSGEVHARSGTFAGELKGASGTFGHVTVKNGDFVLANDETGAQYSATPRRNLIKDHSFELIPQDPSSANQDSINFNWLEIKPNNWPVENTSWYRYGSPKVAIQFFPASAEALPIYGDKAIVVRDANFVGQYIYEGVGAGSIYTVGGHFKRQWNQNPGIPRIEIWHVGADGKRITKIVNSTFARVKNDYSAQMHATTFTVPSNFAVGDSLEVIISGGDSNWVQCDGVQMVAGIRASAYQPEDSVWEIIKGNYRPSARNSTLWSGVYIMNGAQTVKPVKRLTDCPNGWLLVWSDYTNETGANDYNWVYSHIPKAHINESHGGQGVYVITPHANNTAARAKYLYISDDKIVGNNSNQNAPLDNVVLRYVLEY